MIGAQNIREAAYVFLRSVPRFIPTFARDFQLTMDAQRARGYELEKLSGGLVEQVRKMGPIFVPLTIHAIIGSEDIIDAMDLRAFGTAPRTWLKDLKYAPRDYFVIGLGVAIFITCCVLKWGFGIGDFIVPDFFLNAVTG